MANPLFHFKANTFSANDYSMLEQFHCEDQASAINEKLRHSERSLSLAPETLRAEGELKCSEANTPRESCFAGFVCQITLQSFNQGVFFKPSLGKKRSTQEMAKADAFTLEDAPDIVFAQVKETKSLYFLKRWQAQGFKIKKRKTPFWCIKDHKLVGELFKNLLIEGNPDYCETRGRRLYEAFRLIKEFDAHSESIVQHNEFLDNNLAGLIAKIVKRIDFGEPSENMFGADAINGRIKFFIFLNKLYLPVSIVEALIHEAAHLAQDLSHVKCSHGDFRGKKACDQRLYGGGAYSFSLDYLNRVLSGVYPASKEELRQIEFRRDYILEHLVNSK